MPSPDPKTPGDGPPEEDEHGAKLAKFFSELEQDVPGGQPQPDNLTPTKVSFCNQTALTGIAPADAALLLRSL